MVLREIFTGVILILIFIAGAGVLSLELWEAKEGRSKEQDGPVRELVEQVVEDHLGIDLDIDNG